MISRSRNATTSSSWVGLHPSRVGDTDAKYTPGTVPGTSRSRHLYLPLFTRVLLILVYIHLYLPIFMIALRNRCPVPLRGEGVAAVITACQEGRCRQNILHTS